MSTIIVWLLIVSQYSRSDSAGTVTTIERFATQGDCEWVRKQLPRPEDHYSACIQAKIAVPK